MFQGLDAEEYSRRCYYNRAYVTDCVYQRQVAEQPASEYLLH